MQPRTKWTDAQRDEALRLLAEHGKAEAARRTGIPAGTIASWGSRTGIQAPTPEVLGAQLEARRVTVAQRRTALGEQFLATAEKLLRAVEDEESAIDRERQVRAARHAAEASQLLTGGLTANIGMTPAEAPAEPPSEVERKQRALEVAGALGQRLSA